MTEEALAYLHANPKTVSEKMKENPNNTEWLEKTIDKKVFDELKFKIKDFGLSRSLFDNYSEVELENAKLLYNNLKELPRYVLTSEEFWMWICMKKFYKVAMQAMPLKKESTFTGQWIFTKGDKRSIFSNSIARSYFWIEYTIDETSEDMYKYSKFAFEKIERIRRLTFNANSRNIIFNAIRAEKDFYDECSKNPEDLSLLNRLETGGTQNIYISISRDIHLFGSVRLLDVMNGEDIYNLVYNKMKIIFSKAKNGEENPFI